MAASIAVAILAACSGQQPVGDAGPRPTSIADYGTPPAGVPLFYAGEEAHPGWYVAFDWSGKPRGTLKLAQPVTGPQDLVQAPDGSGFLIQPFKGEDGAVLDRLGRPLETASAPLIEMWSDDSRSYCALESSPSPSPGRSPGWLLTLRSPESSSAASHPVAIDSPNLRSGIIAITFGACSPVHDRAVLVYNYFPRQPEIWVIRISDGAVMSHHLFDATYSDLAPSGDGTLIAVNSARSTGHLAGPTAPSTLVQRTADGSVVRALPPADAVLGFSADDSLALVATTPHASATPTHLAVIDVATGNVIWRLEDGQYLAGFLAAPFGAAFALMLGATSDSDPHAAVNLALVHADGKSSSLPGAFTYP
jgi:hypothetical protein